MSSAVCAQCVGGCVTQHCEFCEEGAGSHGVFRVQLALIAPAAGVFPVARRAGTEDS